MFVAWLVVAAFEILMTGRDRRRAAAVQHARAAEPQVGGGAPDAPAHAIVAEPGEAPPATVEDARADTARPAAEPAAEPLVAADPASAETSDRIEPATGGDEAEPAAQAEHSFAVVPRGPFEPLVGAPEPPPLAVEPSPRDEPARDAQTAPEPEPAAPPADPDPHDDASARPPASSSAS